ncbi:MAG: outer membrane lipoprotein-sorting protein [Acidobacteria bacterium]|nr:outer membrane lipoprotein-sorting protein [Acidobacteriota bacterium]
MLMNLRFTFCRPSRQLAALLTLVCLLDSSDSLRADPHGDEPVARYLKESVRREAILTMEVDYQEPQKEGLRLQFTWIRRVRKGLTSHLIRLQSPPSEQGKLLLVHEKPDGGAEYLAYRPNSVLKKKVRISGARDYKYKSLTISVQELIGGELGKYSHQSKGVQQMQGIACNIVENVLLPQFKGDSDYPKSVIYLRQDNGLLQKWELFGKSGQLEKVIHADEIKTLQGFPTVTVARVEELKKKSKLTLRLKEAQYNPKLNDEWFSEKYLTQNSR